MAANEIIKRLEWLIFNFPVTENPKDEIERLSNCINLYCQDAVGEINRQKVEIERLQVELEFKCDNCENIRLSREEYRKAISQAKSEAIKDFAERLKKVISITDTQKPYFDNLVKEMVGDDNA